METPLLAIVIAVPVITLFFLFVLLPRIRRHWGDKGKGETSER